MKRQFTFFFLPLLIVLATATGCGLTATQRNAIVDFAESTATVGKVASDELVSMRNESINMNRNALALGGPNTELPTKTELDGSFKPRDTAVIFKAIGVLKTYGESLQTLVKDTQQENIQKASDNLVKSIGGLPDKYVTLSKQEQGAIGKIVSTGGGLIVEEVRKKHVVLIVKTFKEPVNRLALALANDFDETQNGSLASVFVGYSVRAAAVSSEAFDRCKDICCREITLTSFWHAQANADRSKTVFSDIQQALVKLTKANNSLADTVESNRISEEEIKDFCANVQALVDAVNLLSK